MTVIQDCNQSVRQHEERSSEEKKVHFLLWFMRYTEKGQAKSYYVPR